MGPVLFRISLLFMIPACVFKGEVWGPELFTAEGPDRVTQVPEQRGSGFYRVASVEKRKDKALSFLRIIFHKQVQDARDGLQRKPEEKLWLDTGHLYSGIKVGDVLDLQYSGFKTPSGVEAMQVLVLLSDQQGGSPVWLLSKHRRMINFSQSSYLRMHAPSSDYQIY